MLLLINSSSQEIRWRLENMLNKKFRLPKNNNIVCYHNCSKNVGICQIYCERVSDYPFRHVQGYFFFLNMLYLLKTQAIIIAKKKNENNNV